MGVTTIYIMKSLSKYLTLCILPSLLLCSSPIDEYHLHQAYRSYKVEDYNGTIRHLKEIEHPSLQGQMALANSYYKLKEYQQAIAIYTSMQSTSIKIKQHLYYNIANAYVKRLDYDHAKEYYAKVLQLGEDEDARYNLSLIALLSNKKKEGLGISYPKSQNTGSSQSEKKSDKDRKRDRDKSRSSSGGDGKSGKEENQKKGKLMSNHREEKHPLGSKVYELINEGYIYEKQPW